MDADCTKKAFDGAFLQDNGVSEVRYNNLLIVLMVQESTWAEYLGPVL